MLFQRAKIWMKNVLLRRIRALMIPFHLEPKRREFARLRALPRFHTTTTTIFGKPLKIVDSASFLFIYNEIFNREIYRFKTVNPRPYIVDCGANIGLSVIYFKQHYPNSRIVAFEPDATVCTALRHNITSHNVKDVTIVQKGLWNEETSVRFFSEGADAGRVALESDNHKIVEVETVRLRDYLQVPVDFLKVDIEGAEDTVLRDCKDLLKNVEYMFVEYHSFCERKQTLHEVLEIIGDAGMRYYVEHTSVVSRHPFLKIKVANGADNQINIYAYRHSARQT